MLPKLSRSILKMFNTKRVYPFSIFLHTKKGGKFASSQRHVVHLV